MSRYTPSGGFNRPTGHPIVGRPYFEAIHPTALPRLAMPAALRSIVPAVGSVWAWEPLKPLAYCHLRVISTRWDGVAWIESIPISHGPNYGHRINYDARRHTLGTWVPATVLVSQAQMYDDPVTPTQCVCGLEEPLPCPVHEHEHCTHAGLCCICEFGVAHTRWQRT